MPKRKRAAVLPTNIALLQNLIRRDPSSYSEEFKLQHQHYVSLRDIFYQNPRAAQGHEEFSELIGFITHMCSCYPKLTADFPKELLSLIAEHHDGLHQDLADKIVHCICMLRNKDIISSEDFVKTLFPVLVTTESKQLRTQVYSSLIQMLKTVNQSAKNQKINKMVQALLFSLLENAESNGLWATKIIRELWRRGIWDDSRTVEIMSQAAIHPDTKVAASAVRFFLGADKEREQAMNDDDESDDGLDMEALRHKLNVNKKSGKRSKKLEAVAKQVKRKQHGPGKDATHLNFSAIHLLRDPQGFADKLFAAHLSSKSGAGGVKFSLDQKIDCVNLISRLIGTHKLTVLGLYSFFLKYLTPKQRDVTQFMAAAAQASHDLVPPDVITPMVRKIADEFVSDGVAAEVAAAGLNTIREIVARAPLAIDEPLLHDLVAYRGSKSKPVMMAARSLIQLFRDIDPSMLPSKERGKAATIALRAGETRQLKFGETQSAGFEGLQLLEEWKQANADNEPENDGWEVDENEDSEDDSDDGEWVTIEDDQEYNVSDSDDEKTETKTETKAAATDFTSLAATEILTPADFAKLNELKTEAGIRKAMGQTNEEVVDSIKLTGANKYKQNKEERLAQVHEGREGREFGSRKKKHQEKEHSTTNKQKARKKNFIMMIHKRDVQGKARKSLRDKQKVLRAHITRQKKRM